MIFKGIQNIPLKISNSGTTGSGVTIHIEDSILNALIEKVPWTEVLESLNNKLSRTEETKHIKGTIHILRHYLWRGWEHVGVLIISTLVKHSEWAPNNR